MSKQLKFEPIRASYAVVRPCPSVEGCVSVEQEDFHPRTAFKLTTASETAALIAALQVAHKAQLEAETLTFADLKPGEWFRRIAINGKHEIGFRCEDFAAWIRVSDGARVGAGMGDWPVIRVRATFEDLP